MTHNRNGWQGFSGQWSLSRRQVFQKAAGLAAFASLPAVVTASSNRAAAQDAAQDDDWQAGAGADWKRVFEAAKKEGTLVLGGPGPSGDALVQGFKRDTGISIQWLGGSSNEQTARVQTELRAGNVTVDVLLGGLPEMAFLNQLKPLDDQLLLPNVTDGKYWRGGKIKFCDDAKRRMLQACEYVSGWPIINTSVVKENDITSWKDLLHPKYKGRIGSISPLVPGAARATGAFLVTRFGADFIADLFIKQEVAYTTDYNQLIEWVARKKYDIAFGGIPANLERFRKEGFRDLVKPVLPKDAPGYVTGGFSVLKMPRDMPHPNAATVFLNWYLSKPGATAYSAAMLETSRRSDVSLGGDLDYLTPKEGISYYDTYTEEDYRQRPAQLKVLDGVLKR